jgi:hypothetical protein
MSSLRDKYKATPVKALKKSITEEDAEFSSGRGQFVQLTDGKNRIRFFPSHKANERFYTLRAFYWVKNYADDDSGDEMYNRTVLSARFHYPNAKWDLIDEYIVAARSFIESNGDFEPDEKAAKLEVITNWKTGLQLSRSWVAYCLKISGDKREFGLIEMNKTIRDKINSEVLLEDEDEPITTDPFTDPDNGKVVIINVDKSKSKADQKYTIKVSGVNPLEDEELETFDSAKPLGDLFHYTAKDWDSGLEGIKIFDDANDIGLFADSDWLEHVEEIKAQFNFGGSSKKSAAKKDDDDDEDDAKPTKKAVPAPPAKKATAPPPATKKQAPPIEEDEEPEDEEPEVDSHLQGDEFDAMNREDLKAWIAEKHTTSDSAAEVLRVKKSMEDEDIRVMIREFLESEGATQPDEDDEEETPPPAKKAPAAPAGGKVANVEDVRARLAGLRGKK